MAKNNEYNASSIKTLSQRTHLLKRMSLTFGDETGNKEDPYSSQKTVSIREIIDNSVDEVIAGHASRINVTFDEDGSVTIADNGRGLPVDNGVDGEGIMKNGIILTLGIIQSGGKFELDSDRYSGGLNGVGAASTVSISRRADVTVYRNNNIYELSFKDGEPGFFSELDNPDATFTPMTDFTAIKVSKDTRPAAEKKLVKTGTTVKIWLDDNLFGSKYPINRVDIMERLRGTAFLVPNVRIEVNNDVDLIEDFDGNKVPIHEVFEFENGIEELVTLEQTGRPLVAPIRFQVEAPYRENVGVLQADGASVKYQDVDRLAKVEVVMSYDSSFDYHMDSYVNIIRTHLGGVHEVAFERALVNAFNEKITSMRGMIPRGTDAPIADDYKEGLSVVISALISEPQFTGQEKAKLGGPEVQRAIQKALLEEFSTWVNANKNADVVKTIAKKVSDAAKARQAQREERDLKRQATKLERSTDFPVKLVDCEITHEDESELYIAEGDSALTSLRGARYSKYQALLPIRGKIINANKASMKQVLDNKEVQDIIKCLDAGVGDSFDTDKLRYGRVFIATDADPDGGAISCLLLMLFWELFRPVILEGRLYQLQTPLFVIKPTGEDRIYLQTQAEADRVVQRLQNEGKRFTINRIKGLGEAGKEIMKDTAMNPMKRTVRRITAHDVEAAQEILDIALGSAVPPRKEWIEENPVDIELLD